jgi:biotin carboxyl carrier protein
MKLLITVQGIQYEVDVEVIDDNMKAPVIERPPVTDSAYRSVPATPAPTPTKQPVTTPAPPSGGGKTIESPIAGTVFKVEVKPGQQVKANDVLLVMEAMKMETPIKSPSDAVIKSVLVSEGDAVSPGQKIIEFE